MTSWGWCVSVFTKCQIVQTTIDYFFFNSSFKLSIKSDRKNSKALNLAHFSTNQLQRYFFCGTCARRCVYFFAPHWIQERCFESKFKSNVIVVSWRKTRQSRRKRVEIKTGVGRRSSTTSTSSSIPLYVALHNSHLLSDIDSQQVSQRLVFEVINPWLESFSLARNYAMCIQHPLSLSAADLLKDCETENVQLLKQIPKSFSRLRQAASAR